MIETRDRSKEREGRRMKSNQSFAVLLRKRSEKRKVTMGQEEEEEREGDSQPFTALYKKRTRKRKRRMKQEEEKEIEGDPDEWENEGIKRR